MNIIDQEELEQLKTTGKLPSPKGAALAIIRCTQRDSVSLADLAHVIKADPAFVGRLIKEANIMRGGLRRPIVSIHDALLVIGIPAVRSLALGFSLLSDYGKGNCRNFDYSNFWSRSLLCAIALQALTKNSGTSPGEEMFSVGLLSHIGELALATLFAEEYSRILGESRVDHGGKLSELELQSFVMTHGDLTVAMLRDWGFPKVYVDTLSYLEDPHRANFVAASRQYVLLHSLVLAEHIADICLAAQSERTARMPQLLWLGARLSLEADRLTAICDQVAHEWIEWGALLDVGATPLPPFEELSKAPAQADGTANERMRVLLIDYASGTIETLRATLLDEGHEVSEASNLRKGFETALELRPQIMVVNWPTPEKDGLALIKSLRQTKIGQSIYILILTGPLTEDKLIEVLESGVDDCTGNTLSRKLLAARLHAVQRVVKLQEEIGERRIGESSAVDFAARLQVMARRHAATHEAESRRLAIELHDRVCSSLTAIGLSLGLIERQLPQDTAASLRERISNTEAFVKETILTAREISYDMHPPILEHGGLLPALEDYGQKFACQTGIAVEVTGEDRTMRLPPEKEIALYRIAQEALTNCAKYAEARTATIALDGAAEHATFVISDDGAGFDLTMLTDGKKMPGLGFLSMRERAEAIGGTLTLESAPGSGTRITVAM